jgi:hypothetical protein
LNLGTGSNNADGTGVGITSIGNGRNPYLPFAGADVIVAAGMGMAAASLGGTSADFSSFIASFATSPAGDRYLMELADILGVPSVDLSDPLLTPDQQKQLALALFYLVLRDAADATTMIPTARTSAPMPPVMPPSRACSPLLAVAASKPRRVTSAPRAAVTSASSPLAAACSSPPRSLAKRWRLPASSLNPAAASPSLPTTAWTSASPVFSPCVAVTS